MPHLITPVTDSQVKELQEISRTTFSETFDRYNTAENMRAHLDSAYHLDKLRTEINNPESQFFFIYADADAADAEPPAGYLKLNTGAAQSEPMGDERLELERIYIRASHKRQGLGKALYDLTERCAREKNKRYIWLGVWEHNTPAKNFYSSLGFREIGDHIFPVGDDPQRDILMEKDTR
ncbi:MULTISPECIES: N-acetyltransferase [unclassified Corynebacterium]|uniref:GNAT family N-acetyltransferase n=1 Tax=unclassified Corynebacterium TaxID=2624378 RepID=UPI0029C9F96F|nr:MULTISPECIES: N-acetyltransferase [unclassified Corynebacterium]WPF65490.1 N-acetyltransferase [Corynebacterium sp. 22KM0430]WPF67986.1 N-acetyltransferase [Corynebacterium sp. 21KM1197]